MKFLQDSIERKLTQLLGRRVSFERLNISPLAGQVEAEGMTVSGEDGGRALVTVVRISAKIAVAKALAGQIVIKSLVINGPALWLSRLADGSIDFPRRGERPGAGEDEDKSEGWKFEAQSVQIMNGRVSFQDRPGDSGYSPSAQQINGELKQISDQFAAELKGSVDISKWLSSLPATVSLPAALGVLRFDGMAQVAIRLDVDAERRIHIREVNLRADT